MALNIPENTEIFHDENNKQYIFLNPEGDIILSLSETIVTKLNEVPFVNPLTLELEELRKKAIERINELRKSAPNNNLPLENDFENIPSYLRRGVDLNNESIEYSNIFIEKESQTLTEQFKNRELVFIFLPAENISLFEAEELTNFCGEFMEALEYELETENEPIIGSFLKKLWFNIKKGSKNTKAEIVEDFAKGKKALELKYVELPTAEQTEKLANSAAKIVELLDKQEEGIVRLGALIVLKKNVGGKSKIIIQQLNFELISLLDKKPQLLQNLQTVYELLTGDVKGIIHLDESEAETLTS